MFHIIINSHFEDSLWFCICRCIIHFIFSLLNIGLLLFMRKNQIGSPNATILVKLQTSFDILANIITPFLQFQIHEQFLNIHLARIYCYLWKSSALFWKFMDSSLGIIILITFDRFICIVFPFYYKTIPKAKLYHIIFFILVINCILIPTLYSKDILQNAVMIYNETNYKCSSAVFTIYSFIISLIMNLMTLLSLIILNVLSVISLVRSVNSKIAKNILSRKKLSVRYTAATAISIFCYSFVHMINIAFTISGFFENITSDFIMYYITFLNAFSTVIHPIVYVILFKNVRQFLLLFIKKS